MKQIEEMIEKKRKELHLQAKEIRDKQWTMVEPILIDWHYISSALKEVHHKGQQDLVERICQDMFNSTALVLGLEYVANLKKEVLGGELEPIKTYKKGIEDCVEIFNKEIELLSKEPYKTGSNLGDNWNLCIKQSESYGAYKKLLEIKQQLLKLGEG